MAALAERPQGRPRRRQEGSGGSRLGVAVMRARTRRTCRVTSGEDRARSGRQCRACRPHCLRCRAFDLGPVALRICCAARDRALRPIDAQRAATARHCTYYTARPEPLFQRTRRARLAPENDGHARFPRRTASAGLLGCSGAQLTAVRSPDARTDSIGLRPWWPPLAITLTCGRLLSYCPCFFAVM